MKKMRSLSESGVGGKYPTPVELALYFLQLQKFMQTGDSKNLGWDTSPMGETSLLTDKDSDDEVCWAVDAAPRDAMWMNQCAHLVAAFSEAGEPLPTHLADLVHNVLLGHVQRPKKSGRPKKNYSRDRAICMTISLLISTFPSIRPTRNESSVDMDSACAIVAEALIGVGEDLPERTIEKIWERRSIK